MSQAIQDIYLFEHNPPPIDKEQRIQDLFCNRLWELKKGLERLRTLVTDGGEGMIHAIHGDSRVGKSHYVRKLLLDAKNEKLPCRNFLVSANNLGSARSVMIELFNSIWRVIDEAMPEHAPGGQSKILEEYQTTLREYEPLVNSPSKTFSRKRNRSEQHSLQGAIKLLVPPFDLNTTSGTVETQGDEQGESQGAINDQELVDILHYTLDVLTWVDEPQRAILVIDDLDLLDRDGKEGQSESDRVIDLLRKVATRTQAIVLVTIRQRTMQERDKDFRDFIKLSRLDKNQTTEIYQRHVKLFRAGKDVFSPPVLSKLCDHARGQIGLFLRRCKELYDYGDRQGTTTPLSEATLFQWITYELDDMEQDNKTAPYFYPIIESVRQGKLDVELPREVEQSRLCNNWVRSIGQGRYEIAKLMYEALSKRMEQSQ